MAPAAVDQLDLRLAAKPGLVAETVGDETVLYDPASDQLHHLDPSATAVWVRLDGARPLRQIVADIAATYGVAQHVASRDVAALAASFRDRGLVAGSVASRTVADSGPPTRPPFAMPVGESPPAKHMFGPFRGLRHQFDIATSDPGIAGWLDAALADLKSTATTEATRYELCGAGAQWVVRHDDETVVVTGRLDRAVAVLLWHINTEVVRRTTPHHPVVHAAAAVKNGATVVLPAAPESGKTTTVAGLVSRAGFGYLSDEAIGIDPDTLLPIGYPKPLSIDRGSWAVLPELRPAQDVVTGQWQVPAGATRPGALGEPAPIRVVVEPAYDPNAITQLEPVTPATMLMRLADSAFNFADAPQRNLRTLARLVAQAECYRLPVSELDHAVTLIDELVISRTAAMPAG